MPIINKGRFKLGEVVRRQINTDWPAANTDFDLYVQDLIASGNVFANGIILDIITANTFVGIANTGAILSVFPATTQLVVSTPVFNYNMDQYSGDNPEIYVTAGETISFELKHGSSHPFNIRVSAGGSAYNTGLTHVDTNGTIGSGSAAQGKYTGKLFWKIPYELAGNTYVYQCTNHGSMVGNIVIQGSILDTITNADLTLNNLTSNTGTFQDLTVNGNLIVGSGGASDATISYNDGSDKIVFNKSVDINGNLSVSGDISGNGLIIRGIEISDSVLSGNITAAGGITGNTIAVDSITSNTWNNIYTANVVETAGNLYFTVQRARDSFTAGQNISIVGGEISAEAQFLTVINDSTTITAASGNLTYGMGRTVNDSRNILVVVEGLIQIPETDYTVDGTNLSFADQPPPGANIEIRFFGAEGSSGSRPTLISTVNTFVATGNVNYLLTQTPPSKSYVTIVIDGVTQQNDSYNITGSVVTFTEAPAAGATIDIRIITGQVGAPFNTRTYAGDGARTIFTISSNFNQDQILVFENGIAQVPGTDYTVSSGNVVFNTAPAANVGIQIRELSSSGANLLNTIEGLDQIVGNIIPNADGVRNLGSVDKRFKDLFLTGNTLILGDIALRSSNSTLQILPFVNGNVLVANTITITGSGGGGGGGGTLSATAYFDGSIGLQSTLPRWYPNRPIVINKSVSRVLTAGTDPLSFRILKSGVLEYNVSFGGLSPVENNTAINMNSNDFIAIEFTSTGVGAQDLYVTFLYNEV